MATVEQQPLQTSEGDEGAAEQASTGIPVENPATGRSSRPCPT